MYKSALSNSSDCQWSMGLFFQTVVTNVPGGGRVGNNKVSGCLSPPKSVWMA